MENTRRRGICALLYSVPTLWSIARHLYSRGPDRVQPHARTVLILDFGGFILLVGLFTTLLPSILRWAGQGDQALLWKRAAVMGLPVGILNTCLWTMLALPHVSGAMLLGAVIACVLTIFVLWRIDKHWLHYGIFTPD